MNDGPYRPDNRSVESGRRGLTWRVVGPGGFEETTGDEGFGEQRARRLAELLNAAYAHGVEDERRAWNADA